jgi:hypothetical protein
MFFHVSNLILMSNTHTFQGAEVLTWLGEAPPHTPSTAKKEVMYVAGSMGGAGVRGETLQSFLQTLLGVVRAVKVAAEDNDRAADTEARKLKREAAAVDKAKAKSAAAKVKAEQEEEQQQRSKHHPRSHAHLGVGAALPSSPGSSSETLRNDPEYGKFVKMVSLRVPLGVVRAKVSAAGLIPDVVDPKLHDPDGPVPPLVLTGRAGGGGGGMVGSAAAGPQATAARQRWNRAVARIPSGKNLRTSTGGSRLRGSASVRASYSTSGAVRGSVSGGGGAGGGCGGRALGGGGLLGALSRMRTNMTGGGGGEGGSSSDDDWGNSDEDEEDEEDDEDEEDTRR